VIKNHEVGKKKERPTRTCEGKMKGRGQTDHFVSEKEKGTMSRGHFRSRKNEKDSKPPENKNLRSGPSAADGKKRKGILPSNQQTLKRKGRKRCGLFLGIG